MGNSFLKPTYLLGALFAQTFKTQMTKGMFSLLRHFFRYLRILKSREIFKYANVEGNLAETDHIPASICWSVDILGNCRPSEFEVKERQV